MFIPTYSTGIEFISPNRVSSSKVRFRCALDSQKYSMNDSNGSLPEEEKQTPVLHSCAASFTLCDHFWGATFSAGAQRPSFSVITPGLESGARNCRHRTNCDRASLPLKRSSKLIGNAACSIGGIKRPLPKFQNGVATNMRTARLCWCH